MNETQQQLQLAVPIGQHFGSYPLEKGIALPLVVEERKNARDTKLLFALLFSALLPYVAGRTLNMMFSPVWPWIHWPIGVLTLISMAYALRATWVRHKNRTYQLHIDLNGFRDDRTGGTFIPWSQIAEVTDSPPHRMGDLGDFLGSDITLKLKRKPYVPGDDLSDPLAYADKWIYVSTTHLLMEHVSVASIFRQMTERAKGEAV